MLAELYFSALLALAAASSAHAAGYSGITGFGDSLTDGGNVFAITGGTVPYPTGRFSDGPVWIERLAVDLGAPLQPSVLAGTNFAFGGAESGLGNSLLRGILPVPGVRQQVHDYITVTGPLNPNRLYVLWGGANDFFNGQADPTIPVANITSAIQDLSAAGARRILVNDLPNLGITPEFRGTALATPVTQLSLGFNALLGPSLKAISGATIIESDADKLAHPQWDSNPGLTIFHFQTDTLFEDMFAHPAAYNLNNVTLPAFDAATLTVTGNPATSLFWDTIHPTSAAHRVLGDAAFALAAPEPAALGLLSIGAAPLLLRRRRAA